MLIVGLCVLAVPVGERRSLMRADAYFACYLWLVICIVWLMLCLNVITPDRITVGEGVTTLITLPLGFFLSLYALKK